MTKDLFETLDNATLDDVSAYISEVIDTPDMQAAGKYCGAQKARAGRAKTHYYYHQRRYTDAKERLDIAKDALWAAKKVGDKNMIAQAKYQVERAKGVMKDAKADYEGANQALAEAEGALAACEAAHGIDT